MVGVCMCVCMWGVTEPGRQGLLRVVSRSGLAVRR